MPEEYENYPSIQQRVIASYVRCLAPLTDDNVTLIQQYAQLHGQLV